MAFALVLFATLTRGEPFVQGEDWLLEETVDPDCGGLRTCITGKDNYSLRFFWLQLDLSSEFLETTEIQTKTANSSSWPNL